MSPEDSDTADFVGLISGRAAEGGLLPGLYSEGEVASRFGMTRRMVREHALAKGIGRKYGQSPSCAIRTSTRGASGRRSIGSKYRAKSAQKLGSCNEINTRFSLGKAEPLP